MPTTSSVLYRGAASTSEVDLYTVPNTSTATVVTNIAVSNTASSSATYTLKIDTVAVISGATVPANDTVFIDLKQVIPANATPKKIRGNASATTVNFHISGVEIS